MSQPNSSPSVNSKFNKLKKIVPKSKKNMMIGVGIILLILIIFLIYWFVFRNKDDKKIGFKSENVIPYIHDAKIQKTVKDSKIPDSSQGNEYNLNFWLYINDYTYKYHDKKSIMFKGDKNKIELANPGIYLLPKENTLLVQVGLQTETNINPNDSNMNVPQTNNQNPQNNRNGQNIVQPNNEPYIENFENHNENSEPNSQRYSAYADDQSVELANLSNPFETPHVGNFDQCSVKNIPLQRWVNVNVALNNNLLDISINGKLDKSCVLKGFPQVNKGDLYISQNGGFNGFLSNVVFTNKVITMEEIEEIFVKGPTVQPKFF